MRHIFIINPAAGSRDRTKDYTKSIQEHCQGLDYTIHVSKAPGDCFRIAREAAKQAFRPVTPEIAPVVSMKQLPSLLKTHQLVLCPWEDEHACSLREALRGDITDVAVIIGPEGGMSEEDVAHCRECGAQSVTLGPRILRTETAALASLTMVMACCGEME